MRNFSVYNDTALKIGLTSQFTINANFVYIPVEATFSTETCHFKDVAQLESKQLKAHVTVTVSYSKLELKFCSGIVTGLAHLNELNST